MQMQKNSCLFRFVTIFLATGMLFGRAEGVFAQNREGLKQENSAPLQGEIRDGKVTLNVRNADVVKVIRFIAQATTQNIVIYPSVKGTVSADLRELPWEAALTAIANAAHLHVWKNGPVTIVQDARPPVLPERGQ